MDLSDWEAIHSHYNYDPGDRIKKRIKQKGYHATPEDVDIINNIVLWKLNRQITVDSETVELLNTVARTVKSPQEALSNPNVPELINDLLKSPGIRLPIASTILKFYQPKAFPIIYRRAFHQLFNTKLEENAGVESYFQYIRKCIEVRQQYKIPFEKVDEVLYQKDKDEGHKLL
jgi:hypothetical protein